MKSIKSFLCFLSFILLMLPSCSLIRKKPAEFVLPREERSEPRQSLNEISKTVHVLNKSVGGYPPQLRSEEEKQEVYEIWTDTLLDIQVLRKQKGNREIILYLLAELYRQGHNMKIKGSGVKAIKILEQCLEKYPKSSLCHFSSTYFYLVVEPSWSNLNKAEASLIYLKQVTKNKPNADLDETLIYFYAYQKKFDLAIKQIDLYLRRYPKARNRLLLQKLRKMLNAKKEIYPGDEIRGPSGMWR